MIVSGSYDNIDVSSWTKDEITERLQQLGLLTPGYRSLSQLKDCLTRHLRANHPIRSYIGSLSSDDLKAIWRGFKFKGYFQSRDRTKEQIAKYFLKKYPSKPLQTLKSFLNQHHSVQVVHHNPTKVSEKQVSEMP